MIDTPSTRKKVAGQSALPDPSRSSPVKLGKCGVRLAVKSSVGQDSILSRLSPYSRSCIRVCLYTRFCVPDTASDTSREEEHHEHGNGGNPDSPASPYLCEQAPEDADRRQVARSGIGEHLSDL